MAVNPEEMGKRVTKKLAGSLDKLCDSNESIIKDLFGVPELIGNLFESEEENFGKRLGNSIEKTFKNGDALDYKKIAGSYIGASSIYRLASGGGLYKDKNGNTDLIGIPFV